MREKTERRFSVPLATSTRTSCANCSPVPSPLRRVLLSVCDSYRNQIYNMSAQTYRSPRLQINEVDVHNRTPLMCVCMSATDEIAKPFVRLLLQNGAHAGNYGRKTVWVPSGNHGVRYVLSSPPIRTKAAARCTTRRRTT